MAVPVGFRVVRLVIALTAVAAAIMMLTSSQRVKFDNGLIYTAKYSGFGSFKFFMFANIVFALYSVVTAALPGDTKLWRIVPCFDAAMGMVISAAIAATWTYYNLLNKGNVNVPYGPLCRVTPGFCSGVFGAFIAGVVGFCIHCSFIAYAFQMIFNYLLKHE